MKWKRVRRITPIEIQPQTPKVSQTQSTKAIPQMKEITLMTP
jgi:hypothetical protein